MTIPFIHRRFEGQRILPGINWNRDRASRLQIILSIWRFILYFRWRSALVGGERTVFGFDYIKPYVLGGISFDFDTYSVNVRGTKFSVEFLEMLANPREGYYYFSRQGGWMLVETSVEAK